MKIEKVYDEYFEETPSCFSSIKPLTIKQRKRKKPDLEMKPERKRKRIYQK